MADHVGLFELHSFFEENIENEKSFHAKFFRRDRVISTNTQPHK